MRQKAIMFFNPNSEGFDAVKLKEMTAGARGHGVDILMRDINHYTGESETADKILLVGDIPDGVEEKIRQQYKGKEIGTASYSEFKSEDAKQDESFDSDLPNGIYGDARGAGNTKDQDLRDQRLHQGGVQGALEGEQHGITGGDSGDGESRDTSSIVIPDNWGEMSWAELRALASKIANKNITSKTAARDIVTEEVKKRDTNSEKTGNTPGDKGEDGQVHPETDGRASDGEGKEKDAIDGSGESTAPSDANPAEGTDDAPRS